jgi:hypothetical protein
VTAAPIAIKAGRNFAATRDKVSLRAAFLDKSTAEQTTSRLINGISDSSTLKQSFPIRRNSGEF